MRILIIDSERGGDAVFARLQEALPDIEWTRARTHDEALMPLFGFHLHHDWTMINMSSQGISRSSVDLTEGPGWFAERIQNLLKIPVLAYSPHYIGEKRRLLKRMLGESCTGIVEIATIVSDVCQYIGRLVPRKYLPPFPEHLLAHEPPMSFRHNLPRPSFHVQRQVEAFLAQREATRLPHAPFHL